MKRKLPSGAGPSSSAANKRPKPQASDAPGYCSAGEPVVAEDAVVKILAAEARQLTEKELVGKGEPGF